MTGRGDLEVGDRDSAASSLPRCPRCDGAVTMVTTTGPTEAVAAPCGCRVPPGALE